MLPQLHNASLYLRAPCKTDIAATCVTMLCKTNSLENLPKMSSRKLCPHISLSIPKHTGTQCYLEAPYSLPYRALRQDALLVLHKDQQEASHINGPKGPNKLTAMKTAQIRAAAAAAYPPMKLHMTSSQLSSTLHPHSFAI